MCKLRGFQGISAISRKQTPREALSGGFCPAFKIYLWRERANISVALLLQGVILLFESMHGCEGSSIFSHPATFKLNVYRIDLFWRYLEARL